MTGNPINKNLVHDSVSKSGGYAPHLFRDVKREEKGLCSNRLQKFDVVLRDDRR